MKRFATLLFSLALLSPAAWAEDYVIDSQGQHAYINFRIQHLGYSWLMGRFDRFSGDFSYDEKQPEKAKVAVEIDINSINTNHAERDKHLKTPDFFDAKKYPTATFVSTGFKDLGNGKAQLMGNLTLHGVTKPVTLDVLHVGHGQDPWGGYRRGFEATTTLKLADFNMDVTRLGPASATAQLMIGVEGIRK